MLIIILIYVALIWLVFFKLKTRAGSPATIVAPDSLRSSGLLLKSQEGRTP